MEKLIQLPNKESQIVSPGDITSDFQGVITVWEKNELVGFVFWSEDDWSMIIGVNYDTSDDNISYFLEKYPNYVFKLNTFN